MHLYNHFFVGFVSVNCLMFKASLPLHCVGEMLPKYWFFYLNQIVQFNFLLTTVINRHTPVYGMKLQLVKIAVWPWAKYLTSLNLNFHFLYEMISVF